MNCAACDGRLPPQARFCPECGSPATVATPVEERKLVTVLFCDLVGSTPLSEVLDPETLRSITLRYFAAMGREIEERGGTVEKFIGDAVMAVFGVPTMHEDDARRAAEAALSMLRALAELNAELEPTLGVRLRVRIGVHTGPAVTTTDVSARQALVSGETVNIAARLEQNAGEGEILIGPVTREAIGAAARVQLVGPIRLKGKEEPVTAYRLLELGEDDPQLMRRFDLPFVGRERELAELARTVDAAVVDGCRLVTICGEPGIGKTRLVRAWLDNPGRPVLHGSGRCRPYGEHGSLAPIAEAVHQLLGSPANRPVADGEALAVLDQGLLRDGTPGPSLAGTCAALARVLTALSRERPVVVVVDDCHWAGDPLLDVLDRLIRLTERAPVLFVCLGRLELLDRRPGFGGARARRLVLTGLSAADCQLLVATLTEVSAHLSTATPLTDVAGGNPFYLEQLLAATGDTAGGDRPSVGGNADLPPSLQALVGARIDALDPAERTALDLASVLGREFVPEQVRALANTGPEGIPGGPLADDAQAVPAALIRLGRRRLVEPAATEPAEVLRFSNGLVHEVTYRSMAKRTRAERHERAAGVLADWHAAVAAVAGHLEHAYRYRVELGLRDAETAELRGRAARLLAAAGAQAVTRSDLAWAASLLGRAVQIFEPGEPGWAAAVRQLGEVRVATGHADDGRALLRTVLDGQADPVETAHARLALAVAEPISVAATASVAREALPVFEAAGDELGQARARIRLAQERQFRGRHADADELLTAALAHAVHCEAEAERAQALGAAGISLWRGPTPVPLAVVRCRELLAEHGTPRPVVRATLNCPLAVLLALDDQWAQARASLAEGRQVAEELGYVEGTIAIPIFEATVEALAGNTGQALAILDRAAEAARRQSAGGLLAAIERDAARLLLDEGRYPEAAQRLATVEGDELPSSAADLDGLRARLAVIEGHVTHATELAERAVARAAGTDSPIVRAVAALDQALVLAHLGRTAAARRAADAAGEAFAAKGDCPGVRRVRWVREWLAGIHNGPAQRAAGNRQGSMA